MNILSYAKAKKALEKAELAQEQLNLAIQNGDQPAEMQHARMDNNGQIYTTLKERLDTEHQSTASKLAETAKVSYVDTKVAAVASGAPKGTYATASALQTAFPTGNANIYLVTADGKWYYWNGTAWTAGGVYQATTIAPKSITAEQLAFAPITGVSGKNLFNKAAVTSGQYISFLTGATVGNVNYSASEFIPILPSTSYALKHPDQSAFYTAEKVYISGFGGGSPNVFTTPTNAAYMRISTMTTNLPTQQLEKGTAVTTYESYGVKIDASTLSENAYQSITDKVEAKGSQGALDKNPQKIMTHLENPFVLTRIKTIGDSITAGVGGTGFVAPRNDTSVSWVNMMRNYVTARYNKVHQVTMVDERLTYTGAYTHVTNASSYFKTQTELPNDSLAKKLEFRFYGTNFDIVYTATPDSGKVGIYVDGALKGTLDAYAAVEEFKKIVNFSGLSAAYHNVEVRETNSRNASSTANKVRLEALRIPKTVVVENQGSSGAPSDFIAAKVTSTDDFIFIMLGTNDRHTYLSPNKTKSNLRLYIDHIRATTSAQPILMSANAVAVADDTTASRNFKMDQVDAAIRSVALEEGVPFISNYDAFMRYEERTGVSLDTLLADGLHPNDPGYKEMFNNICRNIGLPILREGMSY